jgi:hypothetical protein
MTQFSPFINAQGEPDHLIPMDVAAAVIVKLNPGKADELLSGRLGSLYDPNIADVAKASLLANVFTSMAQIGFNKTQGEQY